MPSAIKRANVINFDGLLWVTAFHFSCHFISFLIFTSVISQASGKLLPNRQQFRQMIFTKNNTQLLLFSHLDKSSDISSSRTVDRVKQTDVLYNTYTSSNQTTEAHLSVHITLTTCKSLDLLYYPWRSNNIRSQAC